MRKEQAELENFIITEQRRLDALKELKNRKKAKSSMKVAVKSVHQNSM
jgi:hypothetical protein